jgi:transcriptional regulator with XRE-family HTH domain
MNAITFTDQGIQALGEKLRDYRESRRWSLRQASENIAKKVSPGISPSALGDLERGAVTVKAETLLKLSQVNYGDMTFSEMIDILTDHRLAACESSGTYKVAKNQDAIAV